MNYDMPREALLKHITVLDYILIDLRVFLTTHPRDRNALKMNGDITERRHNAAGEFEERFGSLEEYLSKDAPGWKWGDCPWPEQETYNYAGGEERK